MYFFDKKTEYLIWKMQEGQARGVGTVRFLVMDEVCRVEIVITGCGKVQGTYLVYALSGHMQSLLGEIILNKGKGTLSIKCKASAIGHQAFPYTQVTGIQIDLQSEGCLEQKWLPVQGQLLEKKKKAQTEKMQTEKVEMEKAQTEKVQTEKAQKKQEQHIKPEVSDQRENIVSTKKQGEELLQNEKKQKVLQNAEQSIKKVDEYPLKQEEIGKNK